MLTIEKNIVPLIEQQFPSLYRAEGELFITFVKAYYEWLETNLQELVLETTTGFSVGDTITQGSTTGTIIAIFGDRYIVQLSEFDAFRCNTFCNDLTPATSSSGATSSIKEERKYNAGYYARRLSEIRDIDNTIDAFILQFKKKYLPNIQFTTASNKELFIKNSLDFYRAKGTERAVDLFFKLIHGFEARVYYPADDLFRPSDNEWVNIRYLELAPSDGNISMVGQVVRGTVSGATAFAERLIRVKKGGNFINVLFLSGVVGNFQTGENVSTTDLVINVTAKIVGSTTTLTVSTSDAGFEVGEDLYIETGSGKNGTARVSNVVTTIGTVNFDLLEGGWGYTTDAEVLASDRVFSLSSIVNANTDYHNLSTLFKQFETINQDLLQLEISNNEFSVGDTIEAGNSSAQIANGDVVFSNATHIIINFDASTANTAEFSSINEASNAAVVSANDVSVTANVIASSLDSTIVYTSNTDTSLARGDILYQLGTVNGVDRVIANGAVTRAFSNVTTKSINFTSDIGTFRTDLSFYRASDDKEFTITSISNTTIGVIDPSGTFYTTGSVYGSNSGVSATLVGNFSFEEQASFILSTFEETQTLVNFSSNGTIDSLVNTAAVINTEAAYAANTIDDFTPFTNVTIGSLNTIIVTGPGEGYPIDPFYVVYEPLVNALQRYDYEIHYDSATAFAVGDIIEGANTSARGRVYYHNADNRILRVTRLSIADDFSTSDDFMIGEDITTTVTNVTATITNAFELRKKPRVGRNADIESETFSGEGFISSLTVIDSGFGYAEGESVILKSFQDATKEATAIINLGRQGAGQGYHLNRKSFLSSDKYLHDSDFYQEYSYQVLTSLPFETYRDTLIKVLHVAGTKPFGSYEGTTQSSLNITLNSTTETANT